jgi:hypothetical protein
MLGMEPRTPRPRDSRDRNNSGYGHSLFRVKSIHSELGRAML